MFGPFKTPPFADPDLGELRWPRGRWRGTLLLGDVTVPLVLCGPREAPDANALTLARAIPANLPSWRPDIAQALFEHYEGARLRDGRLIELNGSVLRP